MRLLADLILLPFKLLWALVGFIFNITGRLISVLLGFVVMIIGIVLTITVLGAVAGIPLIILGFLIMLRSLFK